MTTQSEEKIPEFEFASETGTGRTWTDEVGVERRVVIYEGVCGGILMEFKRGDKIKHLSISKKATEVLTELLIRRNNLC
jgi:hypothetical protein